MSRQLPTVDQAEALEHRLKRDARRPSWAEDPSKTGQSLKGLSLAFICVVILVPLYTIILTSISSAKTVTQAGGLVVFPGEFSFEAYRQILDGGVVTRAVEVSVGITLVGTTISMLVSVLGAYGLAKPGSFGHRTLLLAVLLTMFFGAGMIPTYLLVSSLGLINSYWSLILPVAVSAFNVILLRGFFMGLDQEILDSARIDGAGEWRVLWSMVLPMSKAVTAVIALFYAVGYWNAFFQATLYINDSEKFPLQVVLRSYVLRGMTVPGQVDVTGGTVANLSVQMAVVVIALLPILAVYPFVQRHFTTGVMLGAVKG
jgi:putative aldouronate transport system permease protein